MSDVLLSHLLAALLYAALAIFVAIRWGKQSCGLALVAACSLTALWAGAIAEAVWNGRQPFLPTEFLATLRTGGWVLFAAFAYADGLTLASSRHTMLLLRAMTALFVIALGIAGSSAAVVSTDSRGGLAFNLLMYGNLTLVTGGAVLLEALVYRSGLRVRYRIKYVCIGVAALYIYDFIRFSDALLFGRFRPTLDIAQAAVASFSAPIIAVTVARHRRWYVEFAVARRHVFQSRILVLSLIHI